MVKAKAIRFPWTIGKYIGIQKNAAASLDCVTRANSANAWVLAEPAGSHKLTLTILDRYSIDENKGLQ